MEHLIKIYYDQQLIPFQAIKTPCGDLFGIQIDQQHAKIGIKRVIISLAFTVPLMVERTLLESARSAVIENLKNTYEERRPFDIIVSMSLRRLSEIISTTAHHKQYFIAHSSFNAMANRIDGFIFNDASPEVKTLLQFYPSDITYVDASAIEVA